jgi:hypothetical protein
MSGKIKNCKGPFFIYKLQIKNGFPISKVKNQNGGLNPVARKLIHLPTNTIFGSIKEASDYFNISYDNLRRKSTQIKNNLHYIN